ncbi:helix-turn-helix domain-containing protein [Aerococcus sp. L_32]|uniref:helix-turn-helix domain-containing protein n=1 Tax=Aerococcus sp. L_32 TaxID=3422316 RepID=UPI003D6A2095
MSIGTRIKELRLERNMTQKDFAEEIGISRSYLGDLENDRKSPSAETISKLSDKLNVSSAYFFGGKKDNSTLKEKSDDESYFDTHQTDFQKLDGILLGISIQAEKDYIALENSDEDPLVLGDLLNNISYVDIATQYKRELIRKQPLEYSFYVFDHIIYILKPVNELSDDDYKIDLNYFTGIQVIYEDPITLEKDIILDEDLTSSKQVVDIIRQHWGDIIYLYFEGREWGWKDNINNKQTLKEVFLITKYGFENEQILDYRSPIEY